MLRLLTAGALVSALGACGNAVSLDAASPATDVAAPLPPDAQAADATPPAPFNGLIWIWEIAYTTSPPYGAWYNATFNAGPIFAPPTMTVGDCSLLVGATDDGLSAGVGTTSGVNTEITFTPEGMEPNIDYDADFPPPPDLFDDGATVEVSFSGATIPGFTLSVVAAPLITAYTFPTSISRSAGFSVTLDAMPGYTELLVVGPDAGPGGILCWTSGASVITVPGALTSLFPAGTTVDLHLYRFAVASTMPSPDVFVELMVGNAISTGPTIPTVP